MSDSQSTIGAGKSGAQSRQRFGPDAPWFFPVMLFVLLLLSPVGCVVCVAVAAIGQRRRVRASRITFSAIAATVVTAIIGMAADDAGPLTTRWHLTSFAAVAENAKVLDGINWVSGFANEYLALGIPAVNGPGWSLSEALLAGTPLGLVLGLWLAAAYSGWMAFRRRALTKFEGEKYEWRRPEGVLDKRRRRVSHSKLMTGKAASFPTSSYGLTGKVGIGVGEYGALLRADVRVFQRPALVLGGIRMGKTRFTLSTISQLATRGSGVLVIDFKGDGEIPTFWANFAHAHDRRFLHFQTADKNGAPYSPPAPTAPKTQAFFDPLMRGNASSRTDMLVKSVDREGDAAAYERAAYEVAQVAFAVAEGTGYDMERGSLNALVELLDLDHLQRVADAKDSTGRTLLADNPEIMARVAKMVETWKKDDILRGAVQDLSRLISTRMVGPAVGAWMRPGPTPEQTVDLVRACLEGDVVVFSLPVQEYGDLARDVGTLVLLDLQNSIAVLRRHLDRHRAEVRDTDAPPPWSPMYVQIEEFGSAGPDSVLGVLNKAGDVQVRPFLSTQSWNDLVAVDGTGVFARRVLDQAGNIFSFQMTENTGATTLSETTEQQTKVWPRGQVEYSGGWGGMGLKAANLGKIDENPSYERQVAPSAFQNLSQFTMVWLKIGPTRATHSFKAGPNRWQETISTAPIPSDSTADKTSPAPGAADKGPSLDDVDDTVVDLDDVPAWGGATLPMDVTPRPEGTPVVPPKVDHATAPQPPARPASEPELPPGWDDEDEGLHDAPAPPPAQAPTQPLPKEPDAHGQKTPTPAPVPSAGPPRERPAPPPPRETPAWEKQWRPADPSPVTEALPAQPKSNGVAPMRPEVTPPAAAPGPPQDSPQAPSKGPGEPAKGKAAGPHDASTRGVAQSGGTVGNERDSSGLLNLDGFDD